MMTTQYQYPTAVTGSSVGTQPMQVVYLNRPARPRVPYTVKYSAPDLTAVKWVSGVQMVLAILCVISQAATLGLADHWNNVQAKFESKWDRRSNLYFSMGYMDTPDSSGTGIWIGIFMIITAAVGIASWKQNRKSLIVTYVVLSTFLIPFSIALIGTSSGAIANLRDCRNYGLYLSVNSYRYYYNYHLTTTTFPPIYLLGEYLGTVSQSYSFHCSHAVFQAWIAFDSVLVLIALMMFILSLVSVVYSSKAACGGCCSCCSCCQGEQDSAVAGYHIQPGAQVANPPAVQQVQQVQQYQQPVMYAAPANPSQAGAVYPIQPSASVACPPYVLQQQQQAPQLNATASSATAEPMSEGKEAPPPGYTENTQ